MSKPGPAGEPSMRGMPMRLPPRAGEVIDRTRPIELRWNGRPHPAFAGDTIASALAASGVQVLARSFKYHRPRGILTADVHDPNCIFEVDGEPNVRGAHRLVSDGMEVRSQGVWPSLRVDAKRLTALLGPFTGPGFYYKTFMAPRPLRPLYRAMLRRFSPGGHVLRPRSVGWYERRFIFHDVVVAGGGPAGMAAAVAAARVGASVLLVENEPELGGHLRFSGPEALAERDRLRALVLAEPAIETLTDAVVFGRYDGNWVAILERSPGDGPRERLRRGRPKVLLVATGLLERPGVFPGNDLPGVMLGGAVRRLLNLYAVRPGHRAVVCSADPIGEAAAEELETAGLQVTLLATGRGPGLAAARGRGRLETVELTDGTRLAADLLVTAGGWSRVAALLGGVESRRHPVPGADRVGPWELPDGVLATGGLVGVGSLEELIAHATAVGEAAGRSAAVGARVVGVSMPSLGGLPEALPISSPRGGIVDVCEDVTASDIVAAAHEGYDSIELNKRYTTATMGNDQGRLSAVNVAAILAGATGRSLSEVGSTTARPPFLPVSLGALAGRHQVPFRETPMHAWHRDRGARFVRTGDWLRPDAYGDPLDEVAAVRSRVGVMDVSALGKLELRGPDVPLLLERVYVNRWRSLAVGSVRYGVMVAEDGFILDDGVTGRLEEQRFMMSTTSSGSERVRRWLEYWLQVEHPDWRVFLTPVTEAYAAMNVAGPRSRQLLARLVDDIDLGADAFPHMAVRQGSVAGVEGCFIWRLGFTGELSYEVYAPAGYGLHVWERLFAEGETDGLVPFGVEAQRTMRIEKGHPVVGQDTDAQTGPYAAGLGWSVKADKTETIGHLELSWQKAHQDELPYRLIGLQTVEGRVVPPEASQILVDGQLAGRVTSSRFSPTLGRSVALGLLAPRYASGGSTVSVRLPGGELVAATVQEKLVHLDPEGRRLHA